MRDARVFVTARRCSSTYRSAPRSRRSSRSGRRTPLNFVDQYISELRRYRAIAMDVGDMDNLRIGASKLHDVFTGYGLNHDFEIYPGNHTNNMAVRFQENVIPFFSRTLSFDRPKKP